MVETSARLLRLLTLLEVRPQWSGADLAARLSAQSPRAAPDAAPGADSAAGPSDGIAGRRSPR